jgi:AraC-like DNA-binding protein
VLRPDEVERAAGLRRDLSVSRALAPFVERYWSVAWDRTGQPPFRSEVLSHPAVNLSVEEGDRPRFGVVMPAVLVHGPVTRRGIVDLVGTGRVTAAKFRPGGWAAFAARQGGRNTVAPLDPTVGLDPARLLADVRAEADDDDRVAVLDAALAPLAPEPAPAYLELCALIDAMSEDRAVVRVEQAAALGAMSTRSLQRLFRAYVGISPKAVLARYRLQDAAAAIDAGEVSDLATLATELGWFDQAHFSRDFRSVVGVTPSAYLARARAQSSTGS